MDKILVGFKKEVTCLGTYYYKELKDGACLEIIKKDRVEVSYIKGLYMAKLTEFKRNVNLVFFKTYIDKLVAVFGG